MTLTLTIVFLFCLFASVWMLGQDWILSRLNLYMILDIWVWKQAEIDGREEVQQEFCFFFFFFLDLLYFKKISWLHLEDSVGWYLLLWLAGPLVVHLLYSLFIFNTCSRYWKAKHFVLVTELKILGALN